MWIFKWLKEIPLNKIKTKLGYLAKKKLYYICVNLMEIPMIPPEKFSVADMEVPLILMIYITEINTSRI